MRAYSLSHLSDPELIRGLSSAVAQHHITTATLLAYVAEVDDRRLYLPAGYPSMYAYCVGQLGMSEDVACKRIRAARAARQFPGIFPAVAEGRLHLAAVVLLAPFLSLENAADLLTAAGLRTKAEIETLLAERFPRPEVLGLVTALPDAQPAPTQVGTEGELVPERVELSAPGRIDCPVPCSKTTPIAPERVHLEFVMGRTMQDKLRHAQELLGHQLPSGDVAQVLERGLDALIRELERRKFAATTRPRPSNRASVNPRHIPAAVKRAVWARDGGQCTFVSEGGNRCQARKLIEFDHVEPVARGGTATVAGIRLRCRAHNQYGAECEFGAGFMREKRESSQQAAAGREPERAAQVQRKAEAARAADEARRIAQQARAATALAAAEEVIAPLRSLGFSLGEARSAARLCEAIPDAPLEHRVRRALSYFHLPRTSAQPAPSARIAP